MARENKFAKATSTIEQKTQEDLNEKIEINTEPEKETTPKETSKDLIDAIFKNPKKERKSSGHTFYLDEEYYKKLKKISKEQGISVSKVLNEILKHVL